MKKKFKLLVLVPILFLTACAATGVQFQKVSTIPEGKGVVYVYRPDSIVGAAIHYDVYAGENDLICDLIRGGYCLYYSKLGELELWGKTEAKSSITIDVKAGQEYYVKGGLSLGVLAGRPNFTLVTNTVGQEEIADCKLLLKPAAEPNK